MESVAIVLPHGVLFRGSAEKKSEICRFANDIHAEILVEFWETEWYNKISKTLLFYQYKTQINYQAVFGNNLYKNSKDDIVNLVIQDG